MSLLTNPSALHAQTIDTTGYIKNIDSESVVLVSNNILGGEICSSQEEISFSFSGTEPLLLVFSTNKGLLTKNSTRLYGESIHNLSTNLKNHKKIRAP